MLKIIVFSTSHYTSQLNALTTHLASDRIELVTQVVDAVSDAESLLAMPADVYVPLVGAHALSNVTFQTLLSVCKMGE
ncbi:MAG: hypothetical protein AAFR67_14875, partial [Chloroflexota bacterium]